MLTTPKVSTWYTLVIFTASMQEYADPVIDWLDAGRGILGKRLFREVNGCGILPIQWRAEFCLVVHAVAKWIIHQGSYHY